MASSERTTEVRRGHEVNVAKLKAYLDTSAASDLPGYHRAMRLEVKQFNAGQSSPTFLLTLSGPGNLPLRCVLRKRPFKKLRCNFKSISECSSYKRGFMVYAMQELNAGKIA